MDNELKHINNKLNNMEDKINRMDSKLDGAINYNFQVIWNKFGNYSKNFLKKISALF